MIYFEWSVLSFGKTQKETWTKTLFMYSEVLGIT